MKIKSLALLIAVIAIHLIVGGITWVVTRKDMNEEFAAGSAQEKEVLEKQEAEKTGMSDNKNVTAPKAVKKSPSKTISTSINSKTYVVKSGDRLSVIAGRYGVSIKKLMEANNIADQNRIFIGQKLSIPLD